MPYNPISMNSGVQGFAGPVSSLEPTNQEGNFKLYTAPLTDNEGKAITDESGRPRYKTYVSDQWKGLPLEGTKRRSEKTRNAMKALSKFVQDASKECGLGSDRQFTATMLTASIFAKPENAYQNLKRLSTT